MNVRDIPERLKSAQRWVVWRLRRLNGKHTKLPVDPLSGEAASCSDSTSWTDFPAAVTAWRAGKFDGLEFALGDGNVGIDLDDVRDPKTGDLAAWASEIVETFCSYTEISPSGTGVHIFLRSNIMEGNAGAGGVEIFTARHFLTVTGDHLPGTPKDLRENDNALRRLLNLVGAHGRNEPRLPDILQQIRQLPTFRESGEFGRCQCPAHKGASTTSLWVLLKNPRRWGCFKGCPGEAILKALGIQPSPVRQAAIEIAPWPDPPESAAYYGLAGELVRAIEPHSEADPVALLAQTLAAFGNVVGRRPHFIAERDRHGMNIFPVMVGVTAKGRKGSSLSQVMRPIREVDPTWAGRCVQTGLSSGEGLIWAVRDPIERREPVKEKGRVVDYQIVIADHGVDDKRLLDLETEFASVLRIIGREGNTLSATVRQSWDSGELRILTKNSPARATGAHISTIGHITRDELRRYLDLTEVGNGFANRFLWLCVRRSKVLPEGGELSDTVLAPIIGRLRTAINFARDVHEMKRGHKARVLWLKIYPELSEGRPGLLGAVISRAEAQVMRMACIYALLDCSALIRIEHLRAALALWKYAEASARYIFGDSLGDSVADELLKAVRNNPKGLTRTEIRDLFGRNRASQEIDRALAGC